MADDNWNDNPYGDNPYSENSRQFRSAHYAQRTSALAVLSLTAGILSFPMMCMCFISIPVSVFAIVCGHMSRGVVRSSHGEYGGIEMATCGMLMGYASLLLMSTFLIYTMAATNSGPAPVPVRLPGPPSSAPAQPTPTQPGEVLLKQAESQLRTAESDAMGIATTDGDATALARHFIETLNQLDKTHFEETGGDVVVEPRRYRVFVQLNSDSVAFLLDVPELNRFTPEALQILQERSWLIAQRSVDDILMSDKGLAVALYSAGSPNRIMTGVTARSGPWDAGLQKAQATQADLAGFFKLDERPATTLPAERSTDSRIETKEVPAEL